MITAFRHLDAHGHLRAPELIETEAAQLEKRLTRFSPDLVRLEVTVTQTRGKTRIGASLRLQLPTGLIATQEEGFEVEPVLRKAFAEIARKLERHVARLRHESEWKRPARRAGIGAPLAPAKDSAASDRRALYFDLIEDHLDAVYNAVRRELTYLEAAGTVPEGMFSVQGLVDATILRGLDHFDARPSEFSVGDWLRRLAFETIESEIRAARRAIPDDAASLEHRPDTPAEEPTEADQEMLEFFQPDEVLLLQDLVADESDEDSAAHRELRLALHRAMADLPAVWRRTVACIDIDGMAVERTAALLDLEADNAAWIAAMARAFLHERLKEAGYSGPGADDAGTERVVRAAIAGTAQVPLPVADRKRIVDAMAPGDTPDPAVPAGDRGEPARPA